MCPIIQVAYLDTSYASCLRSLGIHPTYLPISNFEDAERLLHLYNPWHWHFVITASHQTAMLTIQPKLLGIARRRVQYSKLHEQGLVCGRIEPVEQLDRLGLRIVSWSCFMMRWRRQVPVVMGVALYKMHLCYCLPFHQGMFVIVR